MSENVILTEQILDGFRFDDGYGYIKTLYMESVLSAPLVSGETYTVFWDGEPYTVTAYNATLPGIGDYVTIGDGSQMGYPGNGEPFAICDGSNSEVFFAFTDPAESHTVAIFRGAVEEPETTANILLRDRNGKQIEYPGVDIIKLNRTDGTVQNFGAYNPDTLTPEKLVKGEKVGDISGALTVPTILDNHIIIPNFSGGNMVSTLPDGIAAQSVTVEKPATLTPENIAEGVDIAGIIGTLAAGGGCNVMIKKFTAYNPAYGTHSGVVTLATAEELASAGFNTSGKCFIGILQISQDWSYINSPGTLMNALVFNFLLGSSARGFYMSGYTSGSSSKVTTGVITANAFSGSVVNDTPFYANGEIRYNFDSSMKLYTRDSGAYSRTLYVIAGNLAPTI